MNDIYEIYSPPMQRVRTKYDGACGHLFYLQSDTDGFLRAHTTSWLSATFINCTFSVTAQSMPAHLITACTQFISVALLIAPLSKHNGPLFTGGDISHVFFNAHVYNLNIL